MTGDRELYAGDRRPDMGGHVVGAFVRMLVSPGVFGRQAFQKRLQIGANVRRGVLLDEQACRGVPAQQGQEPGLHTMGRKPIQNVLRDLNEPAPAG